MATIEVKDSTMDRFQRLCLKYITVYGYMDTDMLFNKVIDNACSRDNLPTVTRVK